MLPLLVLVLASALASWLLVYLLRYLLVAGRVLDVPNERSSHTRVIPRGGGLAIFVTAFLGTAAYHLVRGLSFTMPHVYLWVSATLIALISFVDDIRSLGASVRLAVHAGAALLVILLVGAFEWVRVPWVGVIELGFWGPILTFLWIVGLTNAYNFMDGIDGLAAGQAVIAALAWAHIGYWSQLPFTASTAAALAGGSLGFLYHNWSPARIFMGDVGSAYLGFTFAALPVLTATELQNSATIASELPFTGLALVWPFAFDTAFTLTRRATRGERLLTPHRSHLYQRLASSGLQHTTVTSLYICLSAAGLLTVLSIFDGHWSDIALGVLIILATALWGGVRWTENRHT